MRTLRHFAQAGSGQLFEERKALERSGRGRWRRGGRGRWRGEQCKQEVFDEARGGQCLNVHLAALDQTRDPRAARLSRLLARFLATRCVSFGNACLTHSQHRY